MYGRITDGKLQTPLPCVGLMKDGRWVSGYDLLPQAVLAAEGWKPVIVNAPDYDPGTQRLIVSSTQETADSIVVTYEVSMLELTDVEKLKIRQDATEDAVLFLMDMSMGGML